MSKCPDCGGKIARQAPECAYCGGENPAYEPPGASVDALLAGADALMQINNYAAAIELYRLILERVPDLFDPHFRMAHCLSQLRQYTAAIDAMQAALRLYPGHAITLYNLGLLLKASGRSQEARPYFEQAQQEINRNPKRYADLTYIRAGLKQELG